MAEFANTPERLYTMVNEKIGDSPVFFLNHGYSPAYPEFENLPFKHQLSLYKKCIEDLDLNNKTVLEVGCGRGGGSKWISENYNVDMHGCDITPSHIELCKLNESENLHYKFGRADNLPYDSESIDVIISVEASQHFDDLGAFFQMAFYRIKEGGKIVIMDGYGISEKSKSNGMKGIDQYKQFAEFWFQDVEIEIVTENVQNACKEDLLLMQDYIEPEEVAEFMSQVSGESYKRYMSGNRGYFKLTATKIESDVDLNQDNNTVYKNILSN